MSFVIVVTPADPELRALTRLDELPDCVRADLVALRDEICTRFPAAEAIGETGALCRRPELDGVSVVIHPEVFTRPLVVNAVMRFAAPRQLLVTSPEQGLVADPRERIDIEVHRRPTVFGAGITDHAVLGRPRGTLPWVTRELLGQLVGKLEVDGDRLDLEVDEERWWHFERHDGSLLVEVADGPDAPVLRRTLELDRAPDAAEAGWTWARCEEGWMALFDETAGAERGESARAAVAEAVPSTGGAVDSTRGGPAHPSASGASAA